MFQHVCRLLGLCESITKKEKTASWCKFISHQFDRILCVCFDWCGSVTWNKRLRIEMTAFSKKNIHLWYRGKNGRVISTAYNRFNCLSAFVKGCYFGVCMWSEYVLLFHVEQTLAIKADGGKFSQRKAVSVIDTVVNETMTEKNTWSAWCSKNKPDFRGLWAQTATGLNHTRTKQHVTDM